MLAHRKWFKWFIPLVISQNHSSYINSTKKLQSTWSLSDHNCLHFIQCIFHCFQGVRWHAISCSITLFSTFLSRLLRALPPIAAVKSFRSCLMLVLQISIILSKVFLAKMLSFFSPSICLPSISCSKACARGVGIEWVVPSAANFPWLYFPAWGVLETHNCKWALLKEEIYIYVYVCVYVSSS